MTAAAEGHLSVLVQHVRDDETQLGYVTKEHLLNICEFIVGSPGRYGREEYADAVELLRRYHLARLVNVYHAYRSTCMRLLKAEQAKPYIGRCRRCGKTISNPISLAFGHGPICRKKLGIHEKAGDPQEG